jgi:hypothetical protein
MPAARQGGGSVGLSLRAVARVFPSGPVAG